MGTVTALYDTRGAAEAARDGLIGISIHEEDITIRGTNDLSQPVEQESKGFWASLGDLFMPDEDRSLYSEGMRRGGYMLIANVPEGMEREAEEIMDRADPIDLDERSANWRSEGWTGEAYRSDASYGAGAGAIGAGTMGAGTMGGASSTGTDDLRTRSEFTDTTDMGSSQDLAGARAAGATSAGVGDMPAYGSVTQSGDYEGDVRGGDRLGTMGDDQTVQLAKEELRVDKRDVSGGRVRIRTYVVERPVEADVNLRQEHVTIDRRPVDREATLGDDAFQERTIEATERSEEAVVDKVARVKEEIGLHRDVQNRTETVRDSVRETEAEIEDDRATSLGTDRTGRRSI
ncbi:MAG TPA: YsnF/AvaK domain-containing protein [Geminicoccus sp.]|uniref:YsnF/AvaK domain-containing protein n=1 Tax=Geminicoccus sp. TaxID=2024832 RepID=UPI002B6116E2|nr:YsnF/AvaK domain-containing protein [Geminicoccus sp.]HWL71052.1 YsnF/AvaK domain-containing protein [Geminicoccus sp.]